MPITLGSSSMKKSSISAFMSGNKITFNLIRWFSILGLLVICLTSALSAFFLSNFLEKNVLHRDADVTRTMIQSIADKEKVAENFFSDDLRLREKIFVDFFEHIAQVPEIKRANVYSADRTIIWSSKKVLIGEVSTFNPMLDKALEGKVGIEMHVDEVDRKDQSPSSQYAVFENDIDSFVENYIPILNRNRSIVVGVMEVYKESDKLFETINDGKNLVWSGAVLSGLFIYATLFMIIYHGNSIIRQQQQQLVATETLATIGEMSSSIAHNIRNPLASIRSSAELALGSRHRETLSESAREIIEEVDALDLRIQELLTYGKFQTGEKESIFINQLIRLSVNDFSLRLKKQDIRLKLELDDQLPVFQGNVVQLRQVLDSIITNAIEVMPLQGELSIRTSLAGQENAIKVEVSDSGPGISEGQSKRAFHPFHSNKKRGMGLGLPLAKRFIMQHDGGIELISFPGKGTTVTIKFPC